MEVRTEDADWRMGNSGARRYVPVIFACRSPLEVRTEETAAKRRIPAPSFRTPNRTPPLLAHPSPALTRPPEDATTAPLSAIERPQSEPPTERPPKTGPTHPRPHERSIPQDRSATASSTASERPHVSLTSSTQSGCASLPSETAIAANFGRVFLRTTTFNRKTQQSSI
ncbi:hypothetical protein Hypma_005738 [Hypsizygus marmoreus]|uniref:Uncharacterized protein n=1 Tax=Hypsizygus marmoreus TaxID=39966 RepID=A0A369KIL3_HYPMA|nr:hypothetical protein Hypma_005738 [Hypsizygus marmoreus]